MREKKYIDLLDAEGFYSNGKNDSQHINYCLF